MVEKFDHLKNLKFSKVAPTAFTERGLYMLATILKGERAEKTTLAIIDTFVQVRQLARTMEALQNVEDGGTQQRTLLQRTADRAESTADRAAPLASYNHSVAAQLWAIHRRSF